MVTRWRKGQLERVMHPTARELLWRTRVGRTTALRALGRDIEVLREFPWFGARTRDCHGVGDVELKAVNGRKITLRDGQLIYTRALLKDGTSSASFVIFDGLDIRLVRDSASQ